jgi:hypothetical protein
MMVFYFIFVILLYEHFVKNFYVLDKQLLSIFLSSYVSFPVLHRLLVLSRFSP